MVKLSMINFPANETDLWPQESHTLGFFWHLIPSTFSMQIVSNDLQMMSFHFIAIGAGAEILVSCLLV